MKKFKFIIKREGKYSIKKFVEEFVSKYNRTWVIIGIASRFVCNDKTFYNYGYLFDSLYFLLKNLVDRKSDFIAFDDGHKIYLHIKRNENNLSIELKEDNPNVLHTFEISISEFLGEVIPEIEFLLDYFSSLGDYNVEFGKIMNEMRQYILVLRKEIYKWYQKTN